MHYNNNRSREKILIEENNDTAEQYEAYIKRATQLLQKAKGLTSALESVYELGKDRLQFTDKMLQEKCDEIKTHYVNDKKPR